MTKNQAFLEIWDKQGRTGAADRREKGSPSFAAQACRALFDGAMISEFDIRLSRMLYDKVYPENDPLDQGLQLFLVMMAASLSQGNVYLQARPRELAAEYETMIGAAIALAAQDDGQESDGMPDAGEVRALRASCANYAQEFEAAFDKGKYSAIIGPEHKPVVRHRDFWFFQKYFRAHTMLGTLLADRLAGGMEQPVSEPLIATALAEVFSKTALDKLQKIAVALGSLTGTLVITGGPGTGKTTVVAHLLRLMLRLEPGLVPQEDFVICAPTGRAAARLSESIADAAAKIEGNSLIKDKLAALAGRTVHGILGYDPRTGDFLRGPKSPIGCRMIVVDEVSMLDISMFSILLSALRKETTLVLLGDRNQLASVDAGAVLGDITAPFVKASRHAEAPDTAIPSLSRHMHERICRLIDEPVDPGIICSDAEKNLMTDRLVVLTKSFRSQQDIVTIAHRINMQEKAAPGALSGFVHQAAAGLFDNKENRVWPAEGGGSNPEGVLRTRTTEIMTWEKEWIEAFFDAGYRRAVLRATELLAGGSLTSVHQGPQAELDMMAGRPEVHNALRCLFEFCDASAILCVVRRGEAGSETANLLADALLRREIDPHGRDRFFNGSVAMITRNMNQRQLFNGDRGIVLSVRKRAYFVAQRHGRRFDFFPVTELEGLEPSFAMTVHKSQGCEFGSVLAVLPRDKNHPLLTKEIIYTALTRARTRAVILASGDVLDAAIGRKVIRRSGVIAREP